MMYMMHNAHHNKHKANKERRENEKTNKRLPSALTICTSIEKNYTKTNTNPFDVKRIENYSARRKKKKKFNRFRYIFGSW